MQENTIFYPKNEYFIQYKCGFFIWTYSGFIDSPIMVSFGTSSQARREERWVDEKVQTKNLFQWIVHPTIVNNRSPYIAYKAIMGEGAIKNRYFYLNTLEDIWGQRKADLGLFTWLFPFLFRHYELATIAKNFELKKIYFFQNI